MGTVGFLRNYFISKCYSEIFERVLIITIKNISIPLKENIEADFAEKIPVFNFDYRNLMNLISGRKSDLRKNINAGSSSNLVRFFRRLIDSFPFNSLIGEGGLIYIISATLKGLKLIKTEKITHLHSSFRPISDHIIAFNLKLFYPDVRWIADFRDLPVDNYRKNTFLPGFQYWFLKKLISKADEVITVSEGLNSILRKISPDSKVIRNGIFKLYEIEKQENKDHFTLSYTGSLYPEFQKPDTFFWALKTLYDSGQISGNDFKLVYAGKDSKVWNKWISEYGLLDLSQNMGELTIYESVSTQVQSNVLLLLSWSGKDNKGILTGKLFEYLAANNPVIAIINGERDEELEDIVGKFNAGKVFYNRDSENLASEILFYYNSWKKEGKIKFEPDPEFQKQFNWENVREQLRKLM